MGDDPAQYEVRPLGPGGFDATGENAVRVPGSKSLTNRALLLAALAAGTTRLTGVLFADDTRRMMEALQTLGFSLDCDEDAATVTLHGRGGTIPNAGEPGQDVELFLGNAGTATRFLTAACCLGDPGSSYLIKGIPRMHERPIGELVDLLRQLGATIDYLGKDGYPPLRVHGGLRETLATHEDQPRLEVPTTLSSQYISALLQIAPCLPEGLTLKFAGTITSRPYVHMTLGVLNHFGSNHIWREEIRVEHHKLQGADEYLIEPDASNASYFLAAAAVV
ncbi:MAG: 3-phosphoshikimate 1-carboxyvinyltransferase, partial [Phycisphaeraceae bacterium]